VASVEPPASVTSDVGHSRSFISAGRFAIRLAGRSPPPSHAI
jgi:hypothetical protein